MNATIERPTEAATACMVAQIALDAVHLLASTGHTVVSAASGSDAGARPWVAISVAEVVDATGWLFGAESRNVATAAGGMTAMVDGEWRGVSLSISVGTQLPTTRPTSLVETYELAALLVRALAGRDLVVDYVTASHHTYPWGDVGSLSVQVDHPDDVASYLGGLDRVAYDVADAARYYFTGQWRGASLHVGPLAE